MAAYFFKQPILSESYYRSEGDDDVDDEQILDLYWKRSESAITETAKKFGRYCWTIAWNILSDAADAECGDDSDSGTGVALLRRTVTGPGKCCIERAVRNDK